MNLIRMIDSNLGKFPDKPMLFAGDRTSTYAEAAEASRRSAGGLTKQGIGPAHNVAMMAPNVAEFVIAMLGICRVGAAVVPTNHKLAGREALSIIRHAKAKLARVSDEIVPTLVGTGSANRIVPLVGGFLETAMQSAPAADRAIDETATAEILYSSTPPVGRRAASTPTATSATPRSRASPLSNFSIPTLIAGGTLVPLPQYHPEHSIGTLEIRGVTMYFGAPVSYAMPLRAFPSPTDVYFLSISAPYRQRVKPYCTAGFYQIYGMTDTGPTGIVFPPEELGRKAGTIGHAAMPTVDVRVVKLASSDAERGTGEIWFRSESMMVGYLDNPEANAEAIAGEWYKTGYLARIDEDCFIFMVDRLKDAIVTGGEDVYFSEVVGAIAEVPAIAQYSALGMPRPEWAETVAAAVTRGSRRAFRGAQVADRRLQDAAPTDGGRGSPQTLTAEVMERVLGDSFVDSPALQKQDR